MRTTVFKGALLGALFLLPGLAQALTISGFPPPPPSPPVDCRGVLAPAKEACQKAAEFCEAAASEEGTAEDLKGCAEYAQACDALVNRSPMRVWQGNPWR